MISIELIMFIGLSGFLLFLFFYIIRRDKIIDSKLLALEDMIEEINQELFKLKKQQNSQESTKLLIGVEKTIENLVDNIKKIEEKNIYYIKKLEERIEKISSKVSLKNKTPLELDINKIDEQRIINLYKQGYSIEDISKELMIPAGEVELVIKFQKINP